MKSPKIERALISVSNKLGIADFARGLSRAGVEIYSTGGTSRHLAENGVEVIDVAGYTGFPEMMDGRVKTLHPNIFAGILCRHDREDDMQSIAQHGIMPFQLVVVNLYPFAATVARSDVKFDEAVEQIDIGGPSLVRAAAKNSRFVTIITDPQNYGEVLSQVQAYGETSSELRLELMQSAFEHTANYDQTIARYLRSLNQSKAELPEQIQLSLERVQSLRYGENDHQRGAMYRSEHVHQASVLSAMQINGKQLSYNNQLDLDSALTIARMQQDPSTIVIKHNNPCGAAAADRLPDACRAAMAGDPTSAFGSIIGMNRTVDVETAEFLARGDHFVEAIIAPEFDDEAFEVLTSVPKWKKNVRLMKTGPLGDLPNSLQFRQISGGLLVQDGDLRADDPSEWKTVTDNQPSDEMMGELRFAWSISRHVKSNAITVSRDRALVGCGAGQMSRVDSVKIAIRKSGDRSIGAGLASDAFFPFADSIDLAAEAGITAIIQPGGSMRDAEVIEACNRHKIAMIFTGRRHFKH